MRDDSGSSESGYTSAGSALTDNTAAPPASPVKKTVKRPRPQAESEEQELVKKRVMERKRRNRESAERSRQRKIQYYKQLEIDNADLRKQVERLTEKSSTRLSADDAASEQRNNTTVSALKDRVAELEKLVGELQEKLGARQTNHLGHSLEQNGDGGLANTTTTPADPLDFDKPFEQSSDKDHADLLFLSSLKVDENDLISFFSFGDKCHQENNDPSLDAYTGTAVSVWPASILTKKVSTLAWLVFPPLELVSKFGYVACKIGNNNIKEKKREWTDFLKVAYGCHHTGLTPTSTNVF